MYIRGITGLLICSGICLCSAKKTDAAVPLRTIVLTEAQAPGFPQGVFFAELGRPDINADGHVAFSAKFGGSGVTTNNDDVLWSDRTGGLEFVARAGAQALSLPLMVVYKSFGVPILNDEARLAFEANLSGLGVTFENDEAVFSEGASGILGLIAREGSHAAGTPATVNHNGIYRPLFNDDGRVLFGGALKGPGVDFTNNAAFWTGYPGSVSLVVREASQAPGLPAGIILKYGSTDIGPVLGGTNHCAFRAGLDGGGVSSDNDNIIYSGTATMPSVVIREGAQAPGAPAGVNIGNVLQPTINESGATAFLSILAGAVDPSNDVAIFSEGATGALMMLARSGDQAPGAAQGVVFRNLQLPLLSADGSTTFHTLLTGTDIDDANDECIYSDNTGPLAIIAREGDRAPGTPDGVVFAGDTVAMQPAFTGQLCMNDIGHVIFVARLDGPNVTDMNRNGIWQHDPINGTRLIARTGDVIQVAPGDSRVLQQVIFNSGSGGSDGKANGLNEVGQFAFWAWFTDGSEAILVTADTDGDGTVDAFDNCVDTVNANQADADGDGAGDACDNCPDDADKLDPGVCGCGQSDDDTDGDGTPDCFDDCPNDANKTSAGVCGCGVEDVDSDGDLILDCNDNDPANPNPGQMDNDGDGVGDTPPEMEQCCGGGLPAMMPLMLLGWKRRRRRAGRLRRSQFADGR